MNRFHRKEDSDSNSVGGGGDGSDSKEVKVLVLKKTGDVLSWMSQHASIDRCRYNYTQVRT